VPAFWGGFLLGLSSPAMFFLPLNVDNLCPLGTSKGDWRAIGDDFRKVLKSSHISGQAK
jgi:hypothetical protein